MAKEAKATHLNLDQELVKEARIRCIQEGTSLTAVVEQLLRDWLKGKKR